jgi:hypothetical protein
MVASVFAKDNTKKDQSTAIARHLVWVVVADNAAERV